MTSVVRATLAILALATSAHAATLTITPDKSTYQVGETITLSVFGDSEGGVDILVYGRLLFNSGLTAYLGSSQQGLTTFNGFFTWVNGSLTGSPGFADAFNQSCCQSSAPVDGPLFAEVSLRATAPGTLTYAWDLVSVENGLHFFGLTNAPGGSVTIVPEPATALLLGLGLLGIALGARRRS
jgi:hypothetical protein